MLHQIHPSVHFQEFSPPFSLDAEQQKSLIRRLNHLSFHLKGSTEFSAPKQSSTGNFFEQFAVEIHSIIENLQKISLLHEKYRDKSNDLIKTFLKIKQVSIPKTEKELQRILKAIVAGEALKSHSKHPLPSLPKPQPFDKKPLRKGSLLETPAPKVSSRELSHVLGDPFLSISRFSGWVQESAIHAFSSHLEAMLKEDTLPLNEITEIKKLAKKTREILIPERFAKKSTTTSIDPTDLKAFHHAIKQRIDTLSVTDSFLISSGWSGNPGHAIYLEVIRQDEKEYRIRLYNTGSGIEHHCSIIDAGQKKILPYYELGKITKESLCQEIFAEGLLTLRIITSSGIKTKKKEKLEKVFYTSKDLYGAVLDTLKGTPILPTPHELETMSDKFYREQISGTCSYRALMAMAHTHFSEKTYQHMLYESGIKTLVGYYHTQQETLPKKKSQQILLKKATESFLHICLESYRKGFLTKKLLEQAYATTQDIIDRLDALEILSQKQPPLDSWSQFTSENVFFLCTDCQKPTTNLESAIQVVYPELHCLSSEFTPETISDTLKTACIQFHELEKTDPTAAIVYWEKIFEKLPFPLQNEKFWTQIPAKERESCMEYFYKLTEGRLRISARLGPKETIEQRNLASYFAQKCYFIQQFLFKLVDPIPGFTSSINTIYLPEFLKKSLIEDSKDSYNKEARLFKEYPEDEVNYDQHIAPILKYLEQHPAKKALLKGTTPYEQFAESYTDLTGTILPHAFCYWHRQSIAMQYLNLKRKVDFSFKNPGGDPPYSPPTYSFDPTDNTVSIIHEYDFTSNILPENCTEMSEKQHDPLHETIKMLRTPSHPALPPQYSDESVFNFLKSEKTAPIPLRGSDLANVLFTLSEDNDAHLHPFRILNFTAQYPSILTQKEYQDTFLTLFDCPFLSTALQSTDFAKSAKTTILNTIALKNIGLSCWALLLAQRITLSQIEMQQNPIFTNDAFDTLFTEMLSLCKTATDMATAHSARAFFFSLCPPEDFTQSMLEKFLESKTFLAHHPLPESTRDQDIKKGLITLDTRIRTFLKKEGKKFLPALIKKSIPKTSAMPECCDLSQFPWCKCGEYSWHAFDGTIILNGNASIQSIPESIRKHPDFVTLFPNFNTKATVSSDGKIISFDDIRLLQTKDGLKIQKQFENNWYEYVLKEHIPSSLRSSTYPSVNPIIEQTTQWISLSQSEILCFDNSMRTPSYRIAIKNLEATSIEELRSSSFLQKASFTPPSPISILQRIENPSEILVWDKKITLPRLGSSITIKDNRAYLDTPEGFWISAQQKISELAGFEEFLLIENEKHQKKVLIPQRIVDLQSIHSGEKTIAMCRGNKILPSVNLLIFDIDSNGSLFSTNRKDSLYLAYIMLATHHYDTASTLIQKYSIEDINSFSDEEKTLLQSMADIVYETYKNCQEGGSIPNECACFLRVIATIVKNSDMFGWRTSFDTDLKTDRGSFTFPVHFKPMLWFIQSEYTRYLMMLDDVTTAVLNKEEEIRILSLCDQEEAQIQSRISALQQDSRQRIFDARQFQLSAHPINCHKYFSSDTEKKFINPFRAGKLLSENFWSYYKLAKEGDVATLQKLSLSTAEKKYGDYARLLLCVSQHPESFPPFEEKKDASSTFLKEKLVNTANSFLRHKIDRRSIRWQPLQIQPSIPPKKIPPLTPSSQTTPSISQALINDFFATVRKKQIMSEEKKTSLLKALRSNSPDLEKKFFTLREDIEIGNTIDTTQYIFKIHKKEALKKIVLEQRNRAVEECAKKKERLLQQACLIKPSFQATFVAAKLLAGEQTPLCFNDLIAFFLKQDPSIILKKNPSLDENTSTHLNQEIMEYLIHAIRLQQLEKSVELLDEITEAGETKVSELVSLLNPPQAYLPHEHPEYLVFEYLAQKTLRPDQCTKLNLLHDNTDKVLQMIMGSGKSKILAPLLAYRNADGNHLSLLITPEALTQTFAEDMHISQGQFLYQKVRVVNIDRSSDFSAQSLQKLYEDLLDIREKRNCVLMTKKSISCLYLQFEATLWQYFKQNPPGPVPENLQWFQKILTLFKTNTRVLMDEVDQLLFSRQEVNFPLDTEIPVKAERLDCIEDIYHCLAEKPELLQNFSLEKFNHAKKKLASAIIERNTLLKSFEKQTRTAILHYICGENDALPEGTSKVAAVLAILKGELSMILPLTLQKQYQTAYGLSKKNPSKVLAIPYAANNTPVETSDFGNIYEQLNYTMQTYIINGVSSHHIKPYVSTLRATILEAFKANPQKNLETFSAYKELLELVGKPFSLGDDSLFETVCDHLNHDVHARISFVRKYLFPQAIISEKKVSMTPWGFVHMFQHVQGFTGTPWNKDTFPETLRNNTILEKGTDGKTIALLWEHSNHSPIHIHDTSCELLIQQFAEQCTTHSNCRAVIDSGALFHGVDNETVASMLLEKLPKNIKGIVFYKDDTQMVIERHPHKIIPFSQSSLKGTPENRFTYYDQRHTIGADIQQAEYASAFVTFGKSVSLRDYMQAVWRMRKIGKGQTFFHVVSEEMAKLLQEQYGSSDLQSILRYAAEFQFTQEYEHTLVAAVSKQDEVLKQYALEKLLTADHTSLQSQKAIMTAFLIRSMQDTPETVYGKTEILASKQEFREQKLREREDSIKGIVSAKEHAQLVKAMQEQLDSTPIQDHDIKLSSLLEGREVETEREQEQEQQKDLECEKVSEQLLMKNFFKPLFKTPEFEFAAKTYTFTPRKTHDSDEKTENTHTDTDYYSSDSESANTDSSTTNKDIYTVPSLIDLPQLKDVFDKNLLISANALRQTSDEGYGDEKFTFFNRPTHPIEFLCAIRKKDGTIQVRMLRSGEVPSFFTEFETWKKTSQKSEMVLLSMRTGILNHFGKKALSIVNEASYKRLLVQAKFLNGETSYSDEDLKYLLEWIEPHKEALKDFFLKKPAFASAATQKSSKETVLGKIFFS